VHPWEGIAHPTNLLEKPRRQPKQDAYRKKVWGKNWRDQGSKGQQNSKNQDRGSEQCHRVPLYTNSPSAHAGEKVPQITPAIDNSRQSDTRKANPDYYHWEQKKRIHRLHGLTSEELWSNHHQKATIGDEKRYDKVGNNTMTLNKSLDVHKCSPSSV